MKTFFTKRFPFLNFVFVLLLAFGSLSCSKDDVPPTTGDVVVEIRRAGLQNVEYSIYPESFLSSNTYVPPIRKGTLFSAQKVQLKDLNHGNYIMHIQAGHNWRLMLQVTAGRERTFYLD